MLQSTYGLQAGDAIALHLPNTPEILLFHLAAWMIGCITVPLDLKRDDLERKKYKVAITKTKLLVSSSEDSEELEPLKMQLPVLQWLVFDQKIGLQSVLSTMPISTKGLTTQNLDATALVLFTSGTTALPKGVQLSVRNLLLNADGINRWLHITEEDRFHLVLPLHHINSTTFSLATLMAGGTLILSLTYSKSNFWRVMAEAGCTMSSIVPTICFDLLSEGHSFATLCDRLSQLVESDWLGTGSPTDVLQFVKNIH